jgi:hypothetical protein
LQVEEFTHHDLRAEFFEASCSLIAAVDESAHRKASLQQLLNDGDTGLSSRSGH